LHSEDDGVLVGTRGQGVWFLEPGKDVTARRPFSFTEMEEMNITDLYRDSKGVLWISTMGDGLYRIMDEGVLEHLNEHGLASKNVQCVFEDFEHNIWIGTYGQGLVFLPEESVVFYSFVSPVPGNNITALAAVGDRMAIAGDGGLLVRSCEGEGPERKYSVREGMPATTITALYGDAGGRIYIGTAGEGIFFAEGKKVMPLYHTGNILENTINCLTGDEHHLWAGTASGVLKFDRKGHLIKKYSTNEGLPYNNVNAIFLDKKQRAWLATMADGLYVIEGDSIHREYRFPEVITRTQMKSIHGSL
jgi:ligand-binding sensor domain-containing protein